MTRDSKKLKPTSIRKRIFRTFGKMFKSFKKQSELNDLAWTAVNNYCQDATDSINSNELTCKELATLMTSLGISVSQSDELKTTLPSITDMSIFMPFEKDSDAFSYQEDASYEQYSVQKTGRFTVIRKSLRNSRRSMSSKTSKTILEIEDTRTILSELSFNPSLYDISTNLNPSNFDESKCSQGYTIEEQEDSKCLTVLSRKLIQPSTASLQSLLDTGNPITSIQNESQEQFLSQSVSVTSKSGRTFTLEKQSKITRKPPNNSETGRFVVEH